MALGTEMLVERIFERTRGLLGMTESVKAAYGKMFAQNDSAT